MDEVEEDLELDLELENFLVRFGKKDSTLPSTETMDERKLNNGQNKGKKRKR